MALDEDEGENRTIRFDILSGDDGHFRINKRTGEMFVKNRFQSEDANQEFKVVVEARDQGETAVS